MAPIFYVAKITLDTHAHAHTRNAHVCKPAVVLTGHRSIRALHLLAYGSLIWHILDNVFNVGISG